MKPIYLLDSVVLIEHLNSLPQATRFLAENMKQSQISMITRMEVLAGYSAMESSLIKKFLDRFAVAELNLQAADLSAAIRRENHWKLPDAIQAGLAQYYNLKLVTRNTKDFPGDRFSFVLVPY